MTPTPEMEAFAREVATKHFGTSGNGLMIRLMSVAVMEVSERAANRVMLEMVEDPDNEIDTTCNALVSDLYRAIRNGEYLK